MKLERWQVENLMRHGSFPGKQERSKVSKMSEKSIGQVMSEVHANARAHGWWKAHEVEGSGMLRDLTADEILAKIMLVVTELSEAVEDARLPGFHPQELYWEVLLAPNGRLSREAFIADQKREPNENDKPEGFGVELADAVIRIHDLAGAMRIDLPRLVELKHQFNKTRSMRHGGKSA